MSLWPQKRLSEVASIIRGVSFDKNESSDNSRMSYLPILRAGNIGSCLNTDENLIWVWEDRVSEDQLLRPFDVVICMSSGSPQIVGKSAQLTETWRGSAGAFCAVIRFHGINPRLGFYFLQSPIFRSWRDGQAKGANIQNLRKSELEELSIPVPQTEEQERIVRILDEANELRRLRAEADRRAGEMIPALFNELFPSNDPDMSIVKVEEVAEQKEGSIRTGPFGSDLLHSEFGSEGVPVLGIDNVVTNEFCWTSPRCIPEFRYEALKRFTVFPGDILITIMGTVGRCAVAPPDLPLCISTKHLCVVTLDRTRVLPEYLWASILFDQSVRYQTKIVGSGAIMEGWNSTIIRRLKLRLPSLKRQKTFAALVADTKRLKTSQIVSARHLDELFQSSLHRAFQGEL